MVQDYDSAIRPHIENRKWVIPAEALAGATAAAQGLFDLGAADVAIIHAYRGVGPLPPADILTLRVEASGSTMMETIRSFAAAIARIPATSLDAWDPGKEAVVLPSFSAEPIVAGRRVLGPRHPDWPRLDDKTTIDEFWDRAGVARSPSEIVLATGNALQAAARRLDGGSGTAWVADNRTGWHGGGDYVRWVRSDADFSAATEFFEQGATMVRVMPFLEGIPCSVHGWVVGSRVLSFRPVEMLILRRADSGSMQYAGLATIWDPAPADRLEMMSVAKRVGTLLAREVSYRGAFGVDGVMTTDGFRPTELNPRLTAGLGVQGGAVEGLSLGLLNALLLDGAELELDWARFREDVVSSADANRASRCIIPLASKISGDHKTELAWTGREWTEAGETPADATLSAGEHPMGTAIVLEVNPETAEPGKPFGPRAVAALNFARAWGIDVPEFEPAKDVRG